MRPAFRLLAGGADITANIKDRLLSLTYNDEAETKSDRLSIKLDDRPDRETGAHVALPVMGTKLELSLGYEETGLVAMGSFIVDEIKHNGPTAVLEVAAKAADMTGPFRSPTSKSWNDTTLGAIAKEIAEAHGYTARTDPKLGAVPVAHEDQTNESPMAFLNRLAAKHDGIAKPVNGFLVLAPKGTAKSVTGQSLPLLTLRPERLSKWQISQSARKEAGEAAKIETPAAPAAPAPAAPAAAPADAPVAAGGGGVRTTYWDKDKARMVEVTEGKPPYQNTRFACADPKAAKAEAAAVKNGQDRQKATLAIACVGDPAFQAEQRLTLAGFRPGLPTDWRVTKVVHKLETGGYSCAIDAEAFHENQADVAGKSQQ